MNELQVRLRHVSGDLSLGKFSVLATVDEIAQRAFESWPEGKLFHVPCLCVSNQSRTHLTYDGSSLPLNFPL